MAAGWLDRSFPLIHLTLLGQLPYFLAGFVLAGWYSQNQPSKSQRSFRWDAIGAAAWLILQGLLMEKSFLTPILLPLLVAAAYACVFKGRVLGTIFAFPLLTTIGGMCYTIYLYHPFLKSALKHLLFRFRFTNLYWVNSALQTLCLASLIIAVSALLFLLFEKPFMYRDWPARVRAFFKKLGSPPLVVDAAGGRAVAPAVEKPTQPPVPQT